jgi:hypothetical protein
MVELLQNNWLWILPILFIGLYLLGGGCGLGQHGGAKSGSEEN